MNEKQTETVARGAIDIDLRLIAEMIEAGSRVLDIGCGDGALLQHLATEKAVDARGMELSQAGVNACVTHGLSVIQGDADTDLADYPDDSFDYVILSQTLQETGHPDEVVHQMLRIGRHAIVSFPNFGNWRVRLRLLLGGRMPVTKSLDNPWYSTPNIHLCTIRDFHDLCASLGIRVVRALALNASGRPIRSPAFLTNLSGTKALFLLTK